MKHVLSMSKFVTYTYYAHPVDHVTLELSVSPELTQAQIELCKKNFLRKLESIPVEFFPVAGSHASLLNDYHERHPRLLGMVTLDTP